ncbi:MAG TPA: hypothetical protein PL103_07125 [Saccharofermentans sp.]|nr:hypothetical protein [Saccharofermentans sp.]
MKFPFSRSVQKRTLLVLSGLDGTGKSTQANLLSEKLSESGYINQVVWNRWNPYLSAPLIRLAKGLITSNPNAAETDYSSFTKSKQKQMSKSYKRFLWLLLVCFEYGSQVYYRLLHAGFLNKIIISDRYIYDTLIDIAINFSLLPNEVHSLLHSRLFSIFPKPSFVIFFDVTPSIGALRKSDGTPQQYLEDRRPYYLELSKALCAPIVDTDDPLNIVSDRVFSHVDTWICSVIEKKEN